MKTYGPRQEDYFQEDIYVPIVRSSFFLNWLIFFTGSISAFIIYQNHYKKVEQGKQVAEKLAREADPMALNVMNVGINFSCSYSGKREIITKILAW
jgi:hypothetical protein